LGAVFFSGKNPTPCTVFEGQTQLGAFKKQYILEEKSVGDGRMGCVRCTAKNCSEGFRSWLSTAKT